MFVTVSDYAWFLFRKLEHVCRCHYPQIDVARIAICNSAISNSGAEILSPTKTDSPRWKRTNTSQKFLHHCVGIFPSRHCSQIKLNFFSVDPFNSYVFNPYVENTRETNFSRFRLNREKRRSCLNKLEEKKKKQFHECETVRRSTITKRSFELVEALISGALTSLIFHVR